MSATPLLTHKAMTDTERQFFKLVAYELARVKPGGAEALAALLDLVTSWHGCRHHKTFFHYGRDWVVEGNARHPAADAMLRDVFGLNNDPDPRRAV